MVKRLLLLSLCVMSVSIIASESKPVMQPSGSQQFDQQSPLLELQQAGASTTEKKLDKCSQLMTTLVVLTSGCATMIIGSQQEDRRLIVFGVMSTLSALNLARHINKR